MGLIDQLMARRNGIAPQIAQMQGTQMSPMPAPGQSAISGAPPAPAASPPPPQTPPGLFARIGQGAQGYMQALQQDPDKRASLADSLAVGFNSMRLNPDAQLAEGAQQRQLMRAQERRLGAQANRTAQVLRNAGQEELASTIEANPELAPVVYGEYLKNMMNPTETYETLTGAQVNEQMGVSVDPNALFNVNRATRKVEAVGGKGDIYNIGGAVAGALGKVNETYATNEYLPWIGGRGADTKSQIAQLGSVLGRIEAGEQLSGPLIGTMNTLAPGFVNAIMFPDATNAREQVEEVVQRNLREVLGSQFTEKEGERLISRAYNPALPPAENAARLRRLVLQMQSAAEAKDAMSKYFESNNYSLEGYRGVTPGINDFWSALEGIELGHQVRDLEANKVYEYIGGPADDELSWREVRK
jgi:hypothetical protein